MERLLISPELALVDPQLRQDAIALLQAYPPVPVGLPPGASVVPLGKSPAPADHLRRRRAVAAGVYVAAAVARVVLLDALLVLGIVVCVLALSLG